jgi:hypothetical protein
MQLEITLYRTVSGKVTVDVPEGEDEAQTLRSLLRELPPDMQFEVVTDDLADVEREDGTKACFSLSGALAFQRID